MHSTDAQTDGCLTRLQRQLERTYELDINHRVTDFVIACDDGIDYPEGDVAAAAPEKVVIVENPNDDTVDLGVYFDGAVLTALVRDDPTQFLHEGNLETFLTALEGVSHFLYLLWNASYERPVSLMELELQAEVDKFVAASTLLASQRGGIPAGLGSALFDAQGFDQSLSAHARLRYEKANEYAGRYCRQLESQFLRRPANDGLVNELRRFYRLTQGQKLRHIDACPSRMRH